MYLRLPGGLDVAVETLRRLKSECDNCAASSTTFGPALKHYLRWVDDTHSQLRSLFTDTGLADGLLGRPFYELQRVDPDGPGAWAMLMREIRVQAERLQAALDELVELEAFAGWPGEVVVPDTSAFVRGVWFEDFDWPVALGLPGPVRIVVPILVIEELDDLEHRDRDSKAKHRAHQVLKRLRDLCGAVPPGHPASIPARKNVTVEVFADDGWHQRLPDNDGEIIDRARFLTTLTGREVTLVCVDAAMEFRARQMGIRALTMPLLNEPGQQAS